MNKVIVPKYAKATVDKKLLCLVCGVVVKNITMWSMKHIKSEEHIKKVKEYEEKEKTKPNIDHKVHLHPSVVHNQHQFFQEDY